MRSMGEPAISNFVNLVSEQFVNLPCCEHRSDEAPGGDSRLVPDGRSQSAADGECSNIGLSTFPNLSEIDRLTQR